MPPGRCALMRAIRAASTVSAPFRLHLHHLAGALDADGERGRERDAGLGMILPVHLQRNACRSDCPEKNVDGIEMANITGLPGLSVPYGDGGKGGVPLVCAIPGLVFRTPQGLKGGGAFPQRGALLMHKARTTCRIRRRTRNSSPSSSPLPLFQARIREKISQPL